MCRYTIVTVQIDTFDHAHIIQILMSARRIMVAASKFVPTHWEATVVHAIQDTISLGGVIRTVMVKIILLSCIMEF